MKQKHGDIIYTGWNYEVRRDGDKYFGYEKKVATNPRKSFAYIHALETSIEESIKEAMNKIKLKNMIKSTNRVAIKVNLCGGFPQVIASQTPLKGVEGLIDYLLDFMDSSQIYLAEANNWGHVVDKRLLKKRGYEKLCNLKKVKFLSLSYTPKLYFYFKGVNYPVLLSRHLLHPNMKIINFAPLKRHWECIITGASKNLYGAISDEAKTRFHKYTAKNSLDHVIAGCARVYNPEINILGGKCICANLGPHFCRPTRFNHLIIGNDFLAVDKIAAEVLNVRYERIMHLVLNEKLKIWNSNAPLLKGSATIPDSILNKIRKWDLSETQAMANRVRLRFIYLAPPQLMRALRYYEFVIPIVANYVLFGRRGDCNMRFEDE
ncbi:MAG: DUF362 domain-containing protein [Candidatus Lokiarchaeota archaeon]|nr:DUF362 domain-containing protein [Candidatus Lokiarchaeota archaeon]